MIGQNILKLMSLFAGAGNMVGGLAPQFRSIGKQGNTRMLWPAGNGTYVLAKHGPLVDENGKPRYA